MGLFRRVATHAEVEQLRNELTALREAMARPAEPDARLDQLTARVAEVDARVTSVSTELANQLTELGHDIDALGDRPSGDGPGDAVLIEIRDGQVRLANEQARYQMAFREDLARLADELKRAR